MKQVNMKKSDTVFLFSKKLLTTLSVMIFFITARAQNTKYGTNALFSNTTGYENSAFATSALYFNTSGPRNSAFGFEALYRNTTGNNNSAFGNTSLKNNTTGNGNTGVGTYTLVSNITGYHNTACGTTALQENYTGNDNTATGVGALSGNTAGNGNTGNGVSALNNNTGGSYNTALGYNANVAESGDLTNATAIGSNAIVNFSNAIQLGNNSVTKVFAGTGSKATLIAGGLQITGGTLGVGKVLTSDAAGIATWQTPAAGNDWSLTGNAGTVAGTNFIGTTDVTHLVIKTNSVEKMRILDNGNVGIGTSTPASKLDVKGNLSITGGAGAELLGNAKLQLVSGYAWPISGRIIIGDNTGWKTFISTKDANNIIRDNVTFMDNGNVVVGNVVTKTGYKLFVEQGILTEKVRVAVKNGVDWADYVFDKNYELMPLQKVEEFIKTNNHLPNIPSAGEAVKDGIDLGQMNAKLLSKIEELTLYMIEMNKKIVKLEQENVSLKVAIVNTKK